VTLAHLKGVRREQRPFKASDTLKPQTRQSRSVYCGSGLTLAAEIPNWHTQRNSMPGKRVCNTVTKV